MKKNTIINIIVSGVILILAAGVVGLLIYIKNQPAPTRGVAPLVTVALMEPDSAIWGENFPNQYSTLLMTKQNSTRTVYGGAENYDKLAADPNLNILFDGSVFERGYTEDRGHANSIVDVEGSARITDTTPGTCYSCKSSDNPGIWAEMGMEAYDATPFSELGEMVNNPIGCANCHEANTMRLIVTNPALETALEAQGLDWTTFSRQQMRTVVCANCHVEYYFAGDHKYLTLPWENGTSVDAIAAYYDEIGFSDFTHTVSGASMIKIQHPDYELFTAGSTHFMAGVACADCHMPYTRDGAAKFSTHDVHSPLLEPEESCGTCHTDVEYVVDRAEEIQNQVHTTMLNTETAIIAAIEAIQRAAEDPAVDAAKLAEAQAMHRQAQLRWDFIAAENSVGFHNPEEALRILAEATDLARQAQIKAIQSVLPES